MSKDIKRSTTFIGSRVKPDGYNGSEVRVYYVYDNCEGELLEVHGKGYHRAHIGVNQSPLKVYHSRIDEDYKITYIFYPCIDGRRYTEAFIQIFDNRATGLKEWYSINGNYTKKQYSSLKNAQKSFYQAIGQLTIEGFKPCDLLGQNARRVESGELLPGYGE